MSATYLAQAVVTPADLPEALTPALTPLDAVFEHDADQIAAAIEACGTNDLPTLLGHLTSKELSL